jgi:hypothetical protein
MKARASDVWSSWTGEELTGVFSQFRMKLILML